MFETMGESILFTMEKVLGDGFDDQTREAWKQTYDAIKEDMIAARK
jgi:hemoglobin-like flavoprotein